MQRLLEPLQFMRVRRTGLGLHGEARAAVAGLHPEDGIDALIRPVGRGEVFYRQAGVPQPSGSIHKHVSDYKHGDYKLKILMTPGLPRPKQSPARRTPPATSTEARAGAEVPLTPSRRPDCT